MAYPDTFVTMSDEFICRLLPLVGIGTREYIKAGHAALLLIENKTLKVSYFDFGRYVTPKAHGRVRGANTDVELEVPMKAEVSSDGVLENLSELLLWLDAHPEKTHGEGRLLASVCDAINYDQAKEYIQKLQTRGSIPYGAFDKTGSNCARFVTDTILASTDDKRIIKALNFNKKFTPSTVGNVEKADTINEVFEVFEGEIKPFRGSALKENLTNYFHRKKKGQNAEICTKDRKIKMESLGAQFLSGTGSGAWFRLDAVSDSGPNHFRIRRYNDLCELDFDGIYTSEELIFNKPFEFTYDSHCAYCHIVQDGKKIRLDCVAEFTLFNSSQKVHSA